MPNQLRDIRQRAKISQRALAKAVHTSQATIQRIEADVSPVDLSLAERIASFLKVPLTKVFPPQRPSSARVAGDVPRSEDLGHEVIRFRMRDGRNLIYIVGEQTQRRLENIMGDGGKTFLNFVSQGKEVALRRSEVRYMATHEDPEFELPKDRMPSEEDIYMEITFLGETKPERFVVDPDESDEPDELGQLRYFLISLDTAQDSDDFKVAEDLQTDGIDDSVHIVFPFDQILLVEVPLTLLNPKLAAIAYEDQEEEEERAQASRL